MKNGRKQDTQVQVEAPGGSEPRGAETLCAPLSAEQTPERSQTPETAPEAATRAHSGTHGAPEAPTAPASPVTELRQAAAKLRNLVAAIPAEHWGDRPWHTEECSDTDDMSPSPCPCIVAQGEYRDFDQPQIPPVQYIADAETPEHAAYIAAMHPGVGAVLVELLDLEADVIEARAIEDGTHEFAVDLGGDHALTIARLINGTPAAPCPVAAENTQAVTR